MVKKRKWWNSWVQRSSNEKRCKAFSYHVIDKRTKGRRLYTQLFLPKRLNAIDGTITINQDFNHWAVTHNIIPFIICSKIYINILNPEPCRQTHSALHLSWVCHNGSPYLVTAMTDDPIGKFELSAYIVKITSNQQLRIQARNEHVTRIEQKNFPSMQPYLTSKIDSWFTFFLKFLLLCYFNARK